MILAILDGQNTGSEALKEGAIGSLVAILLVFVILLIIIGITTLIFKLTGLFDLRREVLEKEKKLNEDKKETPKQLAVDLENDEDAMAAVLVATIDYQNQTKKDVKLVNVREIK